MSKNRTLVIALALAAAVLAVVVAVGLTTRHSSSGSTGSPQAASTTALPPGHPTVNPTGASSADLSKMIAALKAKLAKNPKDINSLESLGTAYFMSEQYDSAQQQFDRALKLRPGDPYATTQLAMVYHAKGDDTKAVELINGVLAKDANYQEAHYDLAIIYFSQQNLDAAKAEWKKTAAIDPTTKIGQAAQNFVDLMEGRTPKPTTTP